MPEFWSGPLRGGDVWQNREVRMSIDPETRHAKRMLAGVRLRLVGVEKVLLDAEARIPAIRREISEVRSEVERLERHLLGGEQLPPPEAQYGAGSTPAPSVGEG